MSFEKQAAARQAGGEMDKKTATEIAPKQLDRVLGFFARVEAKASFVFATNAALLGILAANVQRIDFDRGLHVTCMATAALLLAASCYFVHRCSFGRRSSATCEPQAEIGLFAGIIRRAALSTNSRCRARNG